MDSKVIKVEVRPTNIDGVDYITVNEFAMIAGKTPSTIYGHAKKHYEPLASKCIGSTILIAVSELSKYGKGVDDVDD